MRLGGVPEPLDPTLPAQAVRALAADEDPSGGGFGAAPKFPPSAVLEFLIRHAAVPPHNTAPEDTAPRGAGTDTAALARGLAGRTLAAMSRSALFDQLDGGFARYSVTRDWSVPHFEKMLYDNAQLLRVYVHWVRLGGTPDYPAAEAADVAGRTAGWLLASLGLGTDETGHTPPRTHARCPEPCTGRCPRRWPPPSTPTPSWTASTPRAPATCGPPRRWKPPWAPATAPPSPGS